MRAVRWAPLAMAAAACGGGMGSTSSSGSTGAPAMFALTLMVTGSGEVDGAGQSCRGQCVWQIPAGTLHLEALADAGWRFATWSSAGNACVAAGCDLIIDAPLTLTATFALDATPPVMHALTPTVLSADFSGFTGACSGTACTVALGADASATASFSADE